MRIFISYRRGDALARGQTSRLKRTLEKGFRCKKVFVDAEDVGVARDFPKKLSAEIEKSDFLLLLIGPDWFDIFERRNEDDRPDWVLYEIHTALKSNAEKIVPVLLDGTECPDWEALPPALAPISKTNALPLSTGADYDSHLERIVGHMQQSLRRERQNRTWWAKVMRRGPVTKQAILDRPSQELKPLRILVVMGENVPYEEALVKAMEQRLLAELPQDGYQLVMHNPVRTPFEDRYASPDDPNAKDVWARLIERGKKTYAGEPIDYVVSVATFASKAVRDGRLVAALDARGQIYMGVTSPKAAGLVDQNRIAGVQYGTGGRDYARTFHELFPAEQRLVFLYNDAPGYDQDRGFAAEIAVLNNELAPSLGGRQRFELRPLGRVMQPRDLELADPANPASSPVYMAWYDLDNMVADMMQRGDPLIFERNLWIIPSTHTKENLNQFGIIVGVNDEAGGRQAANIILHHVMTPKRNLNSFKMKDHGYRVTMKDPVIVNKGLEINARIRSLPPDHKVFRFERRD